VLLLELGFNDSCSGCTKLTYPLWNQVDFSQLLLWPFTSSVSFLFACWKKRTTEASKDFFVSSVARKGIYICSYNFCILNDTIYYVLEYIRIV